MLSSLTPSRCVARNDAGMTLVELVVGMTLMTIVGAIALNFFVGTTAQANRVSEQSAVGGSARTAMTQIAKTLQVADTMTANSGYSNGRFAQAPTSTELAFYSNISPAGRSGTAIRSAPSEVDFKLTAGQLVESVYAPLSSTAPQSTGTSNYPSTPTTKITLVTGITNSAVFTYCSDATDPATTCTATTDPTAIAMVQVTITVQGLNNTNPQTVQSGIAIPGQVS
jgi:type II secretory pathway pseudopilin PulG